MSKRDPINSLRDMRAYAWRAVRIASRHTIETLGDDETSKLALERALEIVGEAANRVPSSFRERNDEIPWVQIVGLRNALAHGYDSVRIEILLNVCNRDLPSLIKQLDALIGDGTDG